MKNPLHGAWHVTGTKTHQPEPTEGLLSGHVNINPHNTLAKPLLMASFCKEEEDAQSNFWPWSTKLVTETEYKAGPFWSQNYASSTIIHCKLFYFLENFSLPLDAPPWLSHNCSLWLASPDLRLPGCKMRMLCGPHGLSLYRRSILHLSILPAYFCCFMGCLLGHWNQHFSNLFWAKLCISVSFS